MSGVDFELLKTNIDTKSGVTEETTSGTFLNRKDLLHDPGEIAIRNNITREVRQEEIRNYEALRHMPTPQELEEEARIAKILQKSQSQH